MERPPSTPIPVRLVQQALRPVWSLTSRFKPPVAGDDLSATVIEAQLDVVRRSLGDGRGVGVHEGEGEHYVYRPGRLLVRTERLEEVQEFFARRVDRYGPGTRSFPVIDGLHQYVLPRQAPDVPTVLEELDTELDDAARPDHVLYVVSDGGGHMCPADEPSPPRHRRPHPKVSPDATAGAGVRVAVVDTGWWEGATTSGASPWLHDVAGDPEVIDPTAIRPYAGHGTFVAGVVRCIAPGSVVDVNGFLTHGGAAYESAIVRELDEAVLETFDPDIISMSAGAYSRKDRGLLAFDVFAETKRLLDLSGEEDAGTLLIVAAAGNDSSTRPFYPAAYDWAVGVGSLDADGTVSSYSNTGPWVDVYALGRDHVNAYPTGTYTCYEPPNVGQKRHFKGLARWSGTSFSTPVVSGAVAAGMTGGLSPRAAYDSLVKAGKVLTDPTGAAVTALGPPFV